MNYLIIEGYKEAAENFSQESGLDASIDFASIHERTEIRTAVEEGRIEEAIEKVNDLDPEVFFFFFFFFVLFFVVVVAVVVLLFVFFFCFFS